MNADKHQGEQEDRNTLSFEELDSSKTPLSLFKSLILPWIAYCQISWHLCAKSEKRRREMSVRLCIIFKDKTTIYQDLLKKETVATKLLHSKVTGNINVLRKAKSPA